MNADTIRERLVDDVVANHTVRCNCGARFSLQDLLDHPIIDCKATLAKLIDADSETCMDLLDAVRKQARTIVETWIDNDEHAQAILRERIEAAEAEAAEEAA